MEQDKSKRGYLSVEEAAGLLLDSLSVQLETERVPILEAVGRICGEDVNAAMNQPPFDRSPLDGYAVCHEDLAGAGKENPAVLKICGTIYAGDSPQGPLKRGEAIRIMTGAPIPEGADCVVRQEDTECIDIDKEAGRVSVFVSLKKHQNYCFQGEDIRQGEAMAHRGEKLTPASVGLLASQGYEKIAVFRKPRTAILSTGSELAEPGRKLEPGKIYDSNRLLLTAYAAEQGAEITSSVSVPDDPETIAKAIQAALEISDLVVSTGGVSVGRHDYLEKAGVMAGARVLFHGVKVKPGSPVLVLEKDRKLIICLSGNPYAAFATFVLLVLPVIRRMQGSNQIVVPERTGGVMKDSFPKASPGRRFVRAFIRDGEVWFPSKGHASGMISSLTQCNCMIDVPAGNMGLKEGDRVEVVMFS